MSTSTNTNYLNPSTRFGGVNHIVVSERTSEPVVDEAPYDDTQYVRVNGEWVPVDTPEIVPDTMAPAPPTDLIASGVLVVGGTAVDYSLSWTPPTTNEDGSELTDFAYYVVRWRYTGPGPWTTFVSEDPYCMLPGLVPGIIVDWEVLARDYSGNDSAWSPSIITEADGTFRATISELGKGSFTGVSVEATEYDADDNPVSGLSIYGTEFLEYLDRAPRGLRMYAVHALGTPWNISNTETELFEFAFDGDPEREFWFHIDPMVFDVSGSADARVALITRTTTGGVTQPTLTSPLMRQSIGTSSGGAPVTVGMDITGQFSLYTRVLVSAVIYSGATAGTVAGNNGQIRAAVYDLGPKQDEVENAFLLRYSGASPPSKKTYITTWSASATQGYDGSGRAESSADFKQGYSSYDGDSHGLVIFGGAAVSGSEKGKTLASALSGATLEKVEVYLYANHWYYNSGGTALIRAYNSTSLSNATPTGTIKSSGSWPKPGGRWVDITSIATTSIRGVTVGKAGSTNLLYYGRFNGRTQSYKPQLRVKYVR